MSMRPEKVAVLGQPCGLALRQYGPGRAGDSDEEHALQSRWLAGSEGAINQGQDQDDIIFMPYTTAQKKLIGITHIYSILASAVSNDMMAEAIEQITALLRQRHRLLPWRENDFSIQPLADVAVAEEESSRTMTLLLGSIASISLLVGGIGIMNIMLVSVTSARVRSAFAWPSARKSAIFYGSFWWKR